MARYKTIQNLIWFAERTFPNGKASSENVSLSNTENPTLLFFREVVRLVIIVNLFGFTMGDQAKEAHITSAKEVFKDKPLIKKINQPFLRGNPARATWKYDSAIRQGTCISEGNSWLNIGGLIGINDMATIMNCYSTCKVEGEMVSGGLLAINYIDHVPGQVLNSFWDIEASGQTESDGGVGLTTVELQNINTFLDADWDFVDETTNGTDDIWWMPDDDYPRLWWEN